MTGKRYVDFIDEKSADAELREIVLDRQVQITPQQIQARFESLRDLTEGQMTTLNKKLVKKLDWRLMPCITLMFLMNYLDRINVSNARLAGLQEDLHISDTQWNTGISSSYVGCAAGCGMLIGTLNIGARYLGPILLISGT